MTIRSAVRKRQPPNGHAALARARELHGRSLTLPSSSPNVADPVDGSAPVRPRDSNGTVEDPSRPAPVSSPGKIPPWKRPDQEWVRDQGAGTFSNPHSRDSVSLQCLDVLQSRLERLQAQVRQVQQIANLGTATAMIAHEVNNLLTPILAYAKASLDSHDAVLQRKALTVTVSNAEMLIGMSKRILQIGAVVEPAAKPEPIPLRPTVEDAVKSLCRDLAKDGIRFGLQVEDTLTVCADRLQLQQVLFNLLLNARGAMLQSRGGRLTVSADLVKDRVVIEVHNTGSVIPPDLLPHIFDPFQTSQPSNREGTPRCGGLGLALCRDLVEDNNGTIDVTSHPESGVTFTITLPVGTEA